MFAKLKKQKSEKPVQQPKLRGMPALKQMRSSKREEYLSKKTKNAMPSLSDLEQKSEQDKPETPKKLHLGEELNLKFKVDLIITPPDYKQSTSPPQRINTQAIQPKYADKTTNSISSDIVIYDELTPPIAKRSSATYRDVEIGSPTSETRWRASKGDSGYKSQSDSCNGQDKKKTKKTRRKNNEGRSRATSGLHDMKQLRKASRESVSQSMRALTPKERESIRVLEEVIKVANENDSADEVFGNNSDVENVSCNKIEEDADEAIDYGYASVNDVSRRYSIESSESVGSIIDLVGNLSASPSSITSPIYTIVNNTITNNSLVLEEEPVNSSNDSRMRYENVINHLDEVINSFCIPKDEENIYEEVGARTKIEEETVEKELASNRVLTKEKKQKGERSSEIMTSTDEKGRKRKEKKLRDPEKEKERKERKRKRKEEKRAMRREKELEDSNEAKIMEENIARHVDTITALTQDMIKTVQEPIYAKVNKASKPKKDFNENIECSDMLEVIDPPLQFSNGNAAETQNMTLAQSQSSEFNFTSTPLASPDSHSTTQSSFRESQADASVAHPQGEQTEAATENSSYANLITPCLYRCRIERNTEVFPVSPALLLVSSENLRHVTTPTASGKSIQIKPTNSDNPGDKGKSDQKHVENIDLKSFESSQNNIYRCHNTTRNYRFPRPSSLNLDTSAKSSINANSTAKPYSSFRIDRPDEKKKDDKTSRPFVITALKKPVQLC